MGTNKNLNIHGGRHACLQCKRTSVGREIERNFYPNQPSYCKFCDHTVVATQHWLKARGSWARDVPRRIPVRDALHAFNAGGLDALRKGCGRPHRTRLAFPPEQAERLRAVLHRSPREFGHPTSVWTLDLAAAVSGAEGLSPTRVSGETIRQTLKRLGVRWQRAKHWITSPDPEHTPKQAHATA